MSESIYSIWNIWRATENEAKFNQYYQRQFRQIVDCLCRKDAEAIIKECNAIREQLVALSEHHGVDVSGIPLLSEADFWDVPEEQTEHG